MLKPHAPRSRWTGWQMSRNSKLDSGEAVGSIIIIIVVMLVVSTTLNYSASNAPESSGTTSTTSSSAPTHSTSTSSSTTSSASAGVLAWSASPNYPTDIWTNSCVESGEYIYCIGGLTGANTGADATDAVYYGPISSSGIGSWTSTTAYPTTIRSETCVTDTSSIYCIGGYTNTTLTDAVYYAPISSSGVGAWTNTTGYPFPVWLTSCVVYGGGVYCVGGGTSESSLSSADSVYFAPFTSSGVGQWTNTTSYPVAVKQQSCVSYSNDIYCVGGYLSTSVYYAPLSTTGVGTWTNTTGYPFTVGANLLSCVTMGDQVFCVGGHTGAFVSSDVYYASLSPSGVGGWVSATSYPVAVFGESCVASGVRIYCIGGETASGSIVDASYASYAS